MKEWYLTPAAGSFGYIFQEYLETDLAATAWLANRDLSEQEEIRCVIQGSTSDSQAQSMERTGLFPCGLVKAGMYLFYNDSCWLIAGYPGTNGIYEKAAMALCQYKIRWQKQNGDIEERWAHVIPDSPAGTGITCDSTIHGGAPRGSTAHNGTIHGSTAHGGTIRTAHDGTVHDATIRYSYDQLSLLLPYDGDALALKGRRIFLDKQGEMPEKVYEITHMDDILYDYGESHGAVLRILAVRTQLDPAADNQDLRICNYIPSPPPPVPDSLSDLSVRILGSQKLRSGLARTYTARFTDLDGRNIPDVEFTWKVLSDFAVDQSVSQNTIRLAVNDEKQVGCSFTLQVLMQDSVAAEIPITVTEKY